MSSDKRLLFTLLHRTLLACALTFSAALPACGEEDPKEVTDSSSDDDDETPVDGDTTGDDDPEPMTMKDAGKSSVKDAGKPPPTPAVDAGSTAPKDKDSGTVGGIDAGPAKDAGTVVTPPTTAGDALVRGDAPTEKSASAKGPYAVKTYTSGYPDLPGYLDSTIHYPEGAQPPFAAVVIVPGFVSAQSSIQAWGPFFASHGIVTMTIGTNTPVDQPPMREAALLDALKTVKSENTREGSPLKDKLDLSRLAGMGWSMGGGGALLLGEHNPELKAVIALCPWNPGYSYAKIKMPTLFLAAQADTLAGGQSQGFYSSIPNSVPKILYEIAGADHWHNNDPANLQGAVGRYGLAWLKVFLEGDERYRDLLKVKGPSSSDWQSNVQ